MRQSLIKAQAFDFQKKDVDEAYYEQKQYQEAEVSSQDLDSPPPDFFIEKGKGYSFHHTLELTPEHTSEEDFLFLLAYRLRMCQEYEDYQLSDIPYLLHYQAKVSFADDIAEFRAFLQHMLNRYTEVVYHKKIRDRIHTWVQEDSLGLEAVYETARRYHAQKIAGAHQRNLVKLDNSCKETVYQALLPFFDEKDQQRLETVLQGMSHNAHPPLLFQSYGNRLLDVFYQLHAQKKMYNDALITADWICQVFQYQGPNDEMPRPFKIGQAKNILYGKKSARQRRIKIEC